MRITEIDTHVVGTPWRNLTYVLVHTDDGLSGVGEARMLGHTDALLGYLAEAGRRHVTGSDPFDIEDLVRRMKYGDYGRAGSITTLPGRTGWRRPAQSMCPWPSTPTTTRQ